MTDATTARVAVVTGAGSGIGRASALALLREGWTLALAGRRAERLEETRRLAGDDGARGAARRDGRAGRRLGGGALRAGAR